MKFSLALITGISQAISLKSHDLDIHLNDDGSWYEIISMDGDIISNDDGCSSEWIWEDWTSSYWRNDCDLEFSEEGECGYVYENAEDWS